MLSALLQSRVFDHSFSLRARIQNEQIRAVAQSFVAAFGGGKGGEKIGGTAP
jgi:hypothetical protein